MKTEIPGRHLTSVLLLLHSFATVLSLIHINWLEGEIMQNATKTVGYLPGLGFLFFCAVVILAGPGPVPRLERSGFDPSGQEDVMKLYGSLPRSFEANEG